MSAPSSSSGSKNMRNSTVQLVLAALLLMSGPLAAQEGGWLAVAELESKPGKRVYSSLEITSEGPIPRAGFVYPAFEGACDSLDGHRLYVARELDGRFAVDRIDLERPDAPPAVIEIPDGRPTALLALGESCLVGGEGWIGVADFGASEAHYRAIHRFEPAEKTIDFFARDGATIVAVDDIAMPFWAQILEIAGDGEIRFREARRLPSVINGHYRFGTAAGGWLYAAVPFGVMDGHGQGLAAFEIARLGDVDSDNPINSGGQPEGHGIWLEEFVERAEPAGAPRLLAGELLSPWTGMAVLERRLLLAAGPRGLLELTLPLAADSRGRIVGPTEGLDVLARGRVAYALSAAGKDGEERHVATLEEGEDGALRTTRTIRLTGRPARFVRP